MLVDVGWKTTPRLALFRAGSFDAAPQESGEPEIVDVAAEYAEHSRSAKVVDHEQEQSSGPSIEDADIIVAGGRGLGAPENFTLAEELARALGGAVGATRAVVDAGWYPYSAQIGQTGKVVSPKLYVALGISGAIQHKVGMQSSNVIVAINKDPNAPIFEFSDLGVVGDVHEIVPKLTELVNQRKCVGSTVRGFDAVDARSDYPPPFAASEFVAEPTDPVDERIEVGILDRRRRAGGPRLRDPPRPAARGAPRGRRAARRRAGRRRREGQAAGFAPPLRRGDQSALVPPPVPGPLRDRGPAVYGPVHGKAVYVLTSANALRIPPPPPMRNHGNWIFSLSQLGRWLGERAEEGGAMILPETAAEKLLLSHGRVVGVRTGDKGRARDGEPMGNFEPGADLVAKVTVLAEGTQGASHRRRARPLRPALRRSRRSGSSA